MENLILVTRGRTGSTAVLDELTKSRSLRVMWEIFLCTTLTEKILKDHISYCFHLIFGNGRAWGGSE